jgi:hypothetical protein
VIFAGTTPVRQHDRSDDPREEVPLMLITNDPKAGFTMSACRDDAAWHLVAPVAALRTEALVSSDDATRASGVAMRDRIVTAGLTFPGTTAWSPPT